MLLCNGAAFFLFLALKGEAMEPKERGKGT